MTTSGGGGYETEDSSCSNQSTTIVWEAYYSEKYGRDFYYNTQTSTVHWHAPNLHNNNNNNNAPPSTIRVMHAPQHHQHSSSSTTNDNFSAPPASWRVFFAAATVTVLLHMALVRPAFTTSTTTSRTPTPTTPRMSPTPLDHPSQATTTSRDTNFLTRRWSDPTSLLANDDDDKDDDDWMILPSRCDQHKKKNDCSEDAADWRTSSSELVNCTIKEENEQNEEQLFLPEPIVVVETKTVHHDCLPQSFWEHDVVRPVNTQHVADTTTHHQVVEEVVIKSVVVKNVYECPQPQSLWEPDVAVVPDTTTTTRDSTETEQKDHNNDNSNKDEATPLVVEKIVVETVYECPPQSFWEHDVVIPVQAAAQATVAQAAAQAAVECPPKTEPVVVEKIVTVYDCPPQSLGEQTEIVLPTTTHTTTTVPWTPRKETGMETAATAATFDATTTEPKTRTTATAATRTTTTAPQEPERHDDDEEDEEDEEEDEEEGTRVFSDSTTPTSAPRIQVVVEPEQRGGGGGGWVNPAPTLTATTTTTTATTTATTTTTSRHRPLLPKDFGKTVLQRIKNEILSEAGLVETVWDEKKKKNNHKADNESNHPLEQRLCSMPLAKRLFAQCRNSVALVVQ